MPLFLLLSFGLAARTLADQPSAGQTSPDRPRPPGSKTPGSKTPGSKTAGSKTAGSKTCAGTTGRYDPIHLSLIHAATATQERPMADRLISADNHIDMTYCPPDLWSEAAPHN